MTNILTIAKAKQYKIRIVRAKTVDFFDQYLIFNHITFTSKQSTEHINVICMSLFSVLCTNRLSFFPPFHCLNFIYSTLTSKISFFLYFRSRMFSLIVVVVVDVSCHSNDLSISSYCLLASVLFHLCWFYFTFSPFFSLHPNFFSVVSSYCGNCGIWTKLESLYRPFTANFRYCLLSSMSMVQEPMVWNTHTEREIHI